MRYSGYEDDEWKGAEKQTNGRQTVTERGSDKRDKVRA